ncbi:MAG: prolyl oligopeptidase family serine peptidase [Dehalococcoidia bacterium]
MTQTDVRPNWFMYFPGTTPAHYRWSSAIMGSLSSAPWGGADQGDVYRVGSRLLDHVGDDELWFQEWRRLGDEVRALASGEEEKGRRLTAAGAYLRACCYYQMGERFRTPKDDAALEAYRTAVDCFHRYAALTDTPSIEPVEVPYEGGSLPGYMVQPIRSEPGPAPCVVFFDGLDVTKELQFVRGVMEIVRRGVACLIMDGPGTGEAIRLRNLPLRYDYEVAGSAALDYLITRGDVDADRIGIMAISLGGYYAPRCASMEPRFKACVAWGAIWDYYATWKRRIESEYNASLSVPGHHITWIFQVDTPQEALEKLKGFPLDGVVQRMRCPFLLCHGEEDAQIPMEDAQALFDAVGSEDKTFRVFTVKEGGAQHCMRDHLTLGITTIADWLAEKL